MKFLVCGIGSIGQRHYKNLVQLEHEVSIFRSRKAPTPFIAAFLREQKSHGRPIRIFYNLDEALASDSWDGVFVTNRCGSSASLTNLT